MYPKKCPKYNKSELKDLRFLCSVRNTAKINFTTSTVSVIWQFDWFITVVKKSTYKYVDEGSDLNLK